MIVDIHKHFYTEEHTMNEDTLKNESMGRRSFFGKSLLAILGLSVLKHANVLADACPKSAPTGVLVQKEGEGMAKALKYFEDGTKAKASKKYVAGANCAGCKHFVKEKINGGYAPCKLMGNKYVSSCGFCDNYLKR